MKIEWVVAVAITATLFSSTANAGFVNQYSQWRDMPHIQKAVYALGAMDGQSPFGYADSKLVSSGGAGNARLQYQVVLDCLADNHINGDQMADMIDNAYARDVTTWNTPPVLILKAEIQKYCESYYKGAGKAK